MLHQPQGCDEGEDFRIRLLLFHKQGQNHRRVLQLAEEFRKLRFAPEHVAHRAPSEHGDGVFFGFGCFFVPRRVSCLPEAMSLNITRMPVMWMSSG